MALFAIIMIYTGGTQAIQNLLIIAALPFSVVIKTLLLFLGFSSLKDFKSDHIIAIMTTENGNAAMINKF
jgi:glycine betaine transporter